MQAEHSLTELQAELAQAREELGRLRLQVGRQEAELTYAHARLHECSVVNELESEVERLQRERIAQLEELDCLKRDFVNTVSHELRTPLTSIMGFAEFMEDEIGGPLTQAQGEYVAHILDGARRLRRIVDDLLDFSRLEAGTLTLIRSEVDLVEVVSQAVESLRPLASEAEVTIAVSWPEDAVPVKLDSRRIGQVVLNLVSNAIKFTPAGGRIDVVLGRVGAAVHVAVTDTGIGVAAEHVPHLFERFYQADPSTTRERGGAGLGLAIAKAFVDAHGGTIGVESTPAVGSRFWFSLPSA